MKRLKEMIVKLFNAMFGAGFRFPLTILSLIGTAALVCYMIALTDTPPLIIQKILYTLVVGAVLGMTGQFAGERFSKLAKARMGVYGAAVLFMAGYFLILLPVPELSLAITTRTLVAVFALVCAILWIPSFKEKTDFNKIALVHFKYFFTSVLYSAVLSIGLVAIIAAVDILLFNIHDDTYAYAMTFVWILFAPVYYLSLVPKFSSDAAADIKATEFSGSYPKILEILVSYIAIPLITAYTLVLIAYFAKILFTFNWPSGQLGPMILAYSAIGLVIFVLASSLSNRFALLYQKIFPKILIPIVIMQLISVGIRLNAYGITESRYYVALFGVFSVAAGVILSLSSVHKNGRIALLAAAFALVSILPPVDAFTVSRQSQINRIETILETEGILANETLTPQAEASDNTKVETTNILYYLERTSSIGYIEWLPKNFEVDKDLQKTVGFKPTFPAYEDANSGYIYASLDSLKPLPISGYDFMVSYYSDRYMDKQMPSTFEFSLDGKDYLLEIQRESNFESRVKVLDPAGKELIGTGLYEYAKTLPGVGATMKEGLPPEEMTLDVANSEYKLRIIFQNVSITQGNDQNAGVDYGLYILFGRSQ
ncbi:MAG: DUF4153 domain-containing protein [Acetobacterium sp.]